ncbi:MAG: TerB family tellurite resistance protein [Bacteroidia bacterium]
MKTITFDRLLLKTAFCCMASDGNIDKREIALIKLMCENSPIFKEFDFKKEINELVKNLNTSGKEFISYYFDLLKESNLSEEEELTLIVFAISTIKADDLIEYAEIKFFKVIRSNLKVSNERILEAFPEIEYWLEDDIIAGSHIDKLIYQYFESAELPKFELITLV